SSSQFTGKPAARILAIREFISLRKRHRHSTKDRHRLKNTKATIINARLRRLRNFSVSVRGRMNFSRKII
ncbi:MAG TPA: hypothetical protein VFM25_15685, partial [Verrucomicrobiae bacterium]|nr:hypothetical protein [Verrucomicrobiae bacterium]